MLLREKSKKMDNMEDLGAKSLYTSQSSSNNYGDLRKLFFNNTNIRNSPQTNRPKSQRILWSGVLLLTLYVFSCSFADSLSQDLASKCTDSQFRCNCGVPSCIDKDLVKNGVKDCSDGSDEGQWDPSKCAIKNRTSEDIRFKRAAIPDFSRFGGAPSNGDASTTFFSNERARTRPVGLLSTSLGAFVTSGTTTEYLTKILGTYIKGTYARIVSTSSRVYHAVPTIAGENAGTIRPTGFIASTTSTEINGYATTLHMTDYYRTYIDGTYAQLVSSSSNVQYPAWYTEQIDPSASFDPSTEVYPTVFPQEVRGNFVNNVMQSRAYAELGIVADNNERNSAGKVKALRPNNNSDNELKVTGTHGKFVHSDKSAGDETTYNVFTGSYVQNSKTFLFFFGNTVIDPSKSPKVNTKPTIMVQDVKKGNSLKVDMSNSLKVFVPSGNSRVKVDGSVGGETMEGIVVEIEGSEVNPNDAEDLISVDGARAIEMGTPSDPRIDMITVTQKGNKQTRVSSSSSSSSSSKKDLENEIPQGRKVPSDGSSSVRLIRPSRTESVSLPTFTVGQPDKVEFQEDQMTTERVVVNVDKHVESSKNGGGKNRPVFQKVTEKPIPRSTERIRALGYTQQQQGKQSKYSSMPNRNHRAFSGFDSAAQFNDVEGDLQSAASTGRATVTYVGFADFRTTIGNTVIVFMPRTKMIEDLSVHVSKTQTARVEPTRFVYKTDDDDDSTTPRGDDEHVQFSVSQAPTGRKVSKGSRNSKTTNDDDDEETTTESNQGDVFRSSVSGRETVFIGKSDEVSVGPTPVLKPKVRPSSSGSGSVSSSAQERRNSLFSSPRVKFAPKSSKASEFPRSPVFNGKSSSASSSPSTYQTASTVVFQTEILNPTGLVTSVDGTIVRDGKTTLYTSLVFGTFIGKSYAQVIKSTSKVIKGDVSSVGGNPVQPSIRPTSSARFPNFRHTSAPVYEVTTTTEASNNDDDDDEGGETTTTQPLYNKDLDRMEVSVTSTTEGSRRINNDEVEGHTTVGSVDLEDSFDDEFTTTTEKNDLENEIGQRKVAGKAKDQIIVDLEATPLSKFEEQNNSGDEYGEEEQTIYVTKTIPTTVFRTSTFLTTFYIPQDGSTSTKVISREVTSSAVGYVRKTFTSIIPSASDEAEVKPTKEVGSRFNKGKLGHPSGSQVLYKTLFTTYTFLTTYFTGKTSSLTSRFETISNVITVTSGIGSTATTSVKITPTGSLRSRSYKTASPRFSSASQGGKTNVGSTSPGPVSSRGGGKSSLIRRPKLSSSVLSSPKVSQIEEETPSASPTTDNVEFETVTKTFKKSFFTTYTYFTSLLNGDKTSIKSRTEVITNVVPFVTKTVVPIISATSSPTTTPPPSQDDEYEEDDEIEAEKAAKNEFSSSTAFRMSNKADGKIKETTFYTTYTYLSTILRGKSSTVKTSKQTFTNVKIGDSTIRSGYVEPIEPTKLTGRSAGRNLKPTKSPVFVQTDNNNNNDDDEDLNEVGSHLSETSETTVKSKDSEEVTTLKPDYYELESSEGVGVTTDRPDQSLSDDDEDENNVLLNEKTPTLKTIYTTFSYFTTYYKGGTSTISSRLETKSQIVTDTAGLLDDDDDVTVTDKAALLSTTDASNIPITYFTTYTFFTTQFISGSSVINSREETVTNIVTPGVDEISSSNSAIKETENNEILPTDLFTTFFTTYSYYTTTYLSDKTIINSRLETVTNVIAPTTSVSQTGRAIGTAKPKEQKVTGSGDKDEYEDYATGLLSTIVSSKVNDRTTTLYSTDVFGTLIDGIYAQVLESTSSVILPTATPVTRFMPEATEALTGVVSVNEGKTVEGDRTIAFATTAYGTLIDGRYAHLVESTSSIRGATLEPSEEGVQKTGLVRIIDGTLVEGDHTTFYTSSILGTFIDGNYAQVIESTSRFVISPTKSVGGDQVGATRIIDVESSITESSSSQDEDGVTTTTEKSSVEQEDEEVTEKPKKGGIVPPKRFGGLNNGRAGRNNSRLAFTGTSKTFTPAITPFASRSRPAAGFVPRRRQSAAVIVTKTEDAGTPTITATPSGSSNRGSFQSRRRFQKPGDANGNNNAPVGDGTTTPTPALPASRTRGGSRFSKPAVGAKSRFTSSSSAAGGGISPTSANPTGGSSPGARGRTFTPRGSSISGAGRGRGSSSSISVLPTRASSSSSAGFRGGSSSSSRFLPGGGRGRSSSTIASSTTQTIPVTQTASLGPNEEEYEVEYEYETAQASSTTTTESPKTSANRYGGSNRFRLSPKLATPAAGTKTTTTRPNTTRGSPLNLRRFSKPTIPTRGTTPAASPSSSTTSESDGASPSSALEEYEEEYEDVSSSTTTSKPLKSGFSSNNNKKPIIVTQRPTTRPGTSRGRVTTTNAPPAAVSTTTRRIYTPRPRPAGFPRAVGPLAKSTTTTTTKAPASNNNDEEYYEEGEFEYQETKNLPSNLTIESSPSDVSEIRVEPPSNMVSSSNNDETVESSVKALPYSGDLFGSSSDLVEAILKAIPMDSSEYSDNKESSTSESDEGKSLTRRKRSLRNKRSTRQVFINNNDNLYYNFGARTARGTTLRSNFPPSSNSRPSSSFSSSNPNNNNNNNGNLKSNSRSSSGTNSDYDYEYYYDDSPQPPPPSSTAAPAPPARQSPSARFRGRIQPTSTASTSSANNRRTPFTLTPNSNSRTINTPSAPRIRGSSNTNSRTSNSNTNPSSRAFIPTRRSQSRYQRPTEAPTTSRSTRFRNSRYNSRDSLTTPAPIISRGSSNSNTRFGSSLTRGRGSPIRGEVNSDPVFEPISTITVTHYVPAETSIPFVNGKSTEYKTILTPSPSIQIVGPYQYTQSDYLGKPVIVLNSEMTATPSFGVTEITRFVIRESQTTSVTFTPTTIRGRKTSFSHIIPSTVYSVENVISTVTNNNIINNQNPLLNDNSQLTNLLLNQLLGQGLLNPANLLALQQPQGQLNLNANPNEPATPYTQFKTLTTTYVTTVTDLKKTIVQITLHGKPLKSTLVESSTNVITATEFITESTVITPTQVIQQQPLTQQQVQPNNILAANPGLLQNLLQLQQQQLQNQQAILPTQAPFINPLLQLQTQSALNLNNNNDKSEKSSNNNNNNNNKNVAEKDFNQEEESIQNTNTKAPEPPSQPAQPASTVITLYVSGKNPGEFSTVLQTIPVTASSRRKRSVDAFDALSDASKSDGNIIKPSRSSSLSNVEQSTTPSSFGVVDLSIADSFVDEESFITDQDFDDFNDPTATNTRNSDNDKPFVNFSSNLNDNTINYLEDSYSYSEPSILGGQSTRNNYYGGDATATESLDSVLLGDFSNLYSQSVSHSL